MVLDEFYIKNKVLDILRKGSKTIRFMVYPQEKEKQ